MKPQTLTLSNVGLRMGTEMRKYAPQMILLALVIFFSIISPNFLTSRNIIIIIRQVSFAAISAVGVIFVMIAGGIDLSIGSQIVMTNIVLAIMMVDWNLPLSLAIPLTLLLGTVLGTLNGLLSVVLNVHPLIITLGTASIYKGLGYIFAQSRNIMGFPEAFRWFGQGYIGPVPVPIVIMIIMALIGSFILTRTYFGRFVFALGGNEEAARLAGVNINGMKVLLYAMCGFISGITSVLLLSRTFAGQTATGQGIEFDALTAALLGGVSFKGGEGTIFGLMTGILIIGVLNNAMQLASFPDFSQSVVKGAVLLAAVGFDVFQKNRKAKETVRKVAP
jgi:ribose/xylose/arabinose/galactoside ABC-type transport system permease subunit